MVVLISIGLVAALAWPVIATRFITRELREIARGVWSAREQLWALRNEFSAFSGVNLTPDDPAHRYWCGSYLEEIRNVVEREGELLRLKRGENVERFLRAYGYQERHQATPTPSAPDQ